MLVTTHLIPGVPDGMDGHHEALDALRVKLHEIDDRSDGSILPTDGAHAKSLAIHRRRHGGPYVKPNLRDTCRVSL